MSLLLATQLDSRLRGNDGDVVGSNKYNHYFQCGLGMTGIELVNSTTVIPAQAGIQLQTVQ